VSAAEVSLISCHVSCYRFLPQWSNNHLAKKKRKMDKNMDVKIGELPNENGTFQKTSAITVTPDEWKNNKFICVVKHQGKTANEIRTNS
ncbi:hypothetical protein M9458_039143, partial [Cirrhinus mrigala]